MDFGDPGALVHLLRAELLALLAKSITILAAEERLVITLYYFEELSNVEVARVMERSERHVVRLRPTAITNMRAALGEHVVR